MTTKEAATLDMEDWPRVAEGKYTFATAAGGRGALLRGWIERFWSDDQLVVADAKQNSGCTRCSYSTNDAKSGHERVARHDSPNLGFGEVCRVCGSKVYTKVCNLLLAWI